MYCSSCTRSRTSVCRFRCSAIAGIEAGAIINTPVRHARCTHRILLFPVIVKPLSGDSYFSDKRSQEVACHCCGHSRQEARQARHARPPNRTVEVGSPPVDGASAHIYVPSRKKPRLLRLGYFHTNAAPFTTAPLRNKKCVFRSNGALGNDQSVVPICARITSLNKVERYISTFLETGDRHSSDMSFLPSSVSRTFSLCHLPVS